MGRVQLVKSIIHGMLVYSFWPISLLKNIDLWFRNFIWSGDVGIHKIVTVSWSKVCSPIKEGGLGVRSTRKLNEAGILKLSWDLVSSKNQWANFLKARCFENRRLASHYISSFIWHGIKGSIHEVFPNYCWHLGDGASINFWRDCWLSAPLVDMLQIPPNQHSLLLARVCDFIRNYTWVIPAELVDHHPQIAHLIQRVTIPREWRKDSLVWSPSPSGNLSFKEAYLIKSPHTQELECSKLFWSPCIPPSKSFLVWTLEVTA